jgi:hypothetical protein
MYSQIPKSGLLTFRIGSNICGNKSMVQFGDFRTDIITLIIYNTLNQWKSNLISFLIFLAFGNHSSD